MPYAPYPGDFSSPFHTSPFYGAFAWRGDDIDRGRDHDHDGDRHHDADRGEHQLGGGWHGGGQVAAAPANHH